MTVSDRGDQRTRVLVVEDERIVARDLAETLATLGYLVVDVVATGEAAIESARIHRPCAILMDIRLGGVLDGIEAAARVHAERDVPVIYLTAHADDDTLRRATKTAPLGYLVKPFRSAELRCAIEIAIHRHEIEAQLRERTGQLAAANKELEAFSYSVAHDLRAPLRGITGFSQVLIEEHAGNLGPEGVGHLLRVRKAAGRMAQLVDDLLELSRVAQSELLRQPVDLSQLARTVTGALQHAHPDRSVELVIQDDVAGDGDERLLQIVLENLIGNAWKFTSKTASARIEFGVLKDAAAPIYFVRDNGAGFPMQYAHKLFGAFQRLHLASEFEGTGIGLALVQRIIHRHGGRIWADSAPGQPTAFSFALDGAA